MRFLIFKGLPVAVGSLVFLWSPVFAAGAGAARPEPRGPAPCEQGATVKEVSFEEAMTVAYTGNPQLLAVRQEVNKAAAGVLGAWTGFLPALNFSMVGERFVSYIPGATPVAVNNTIVGGQASVYTSYPSLSVNWNFYSGGKDVAGYRGAKADERAANDDVRDKTGSTLAAAISAYGDLVKAQYSATQQRESILLLRRIAERTLSRYGQGRENLVAVDQARTRAAQAERTYFDACKAISDKSSGLAQALGLKMGAALLLRASTDAIPVAPELIGNAAQFDAVVDQDPGVVAARERIESAQQKLEQAWAAVKPTLGLFGRYDGLGQSRGSFDAAFNATGRNSYQVGLVLQQPLGPFTAETAAIQSAQSDVRKAEALLSAAQVDAGARLRSALNSKQQATRALEAAHESALRAVEARGLTEQLNRAGRTNEDSVDQSTVAVLTETEAAKERATDEIVQGWLIYRAIKPAEFEARLVRLADPMKPVEP